MDISFSAQDLEFQKEVREFFATSFTDEIKQRLRQWQRNQSCFYRMAKNLKR